MRLGGLQWLTHGVKPFVTNEVPHLVNNTGRASEDAAALLFVNCLGAGDDEDQIRVLELGAGLGLFARYFLDAFRCTCEREGRDFYHRLVYFVSDRSPKTVAQWAQRELFNEHAPHVVLGTCDATNLSTFLDLQGQPVDFGPLRACFASYVLDVLPFAIVRAGSMGAEQLCVRSHLTNNAKLLPSYGPLTVGQVRELANSRNPGDRLKLLPVLNILEFETAFLPVALDGLPYLQEALALANASQRVSLNYGAIQCLEAVLDRMDGRGFVLVNEYGPVQSAQVSDQAVPQRFGQLTALGLNFPFLEHHFSNAGRLILKAEGDDKRPIHSRILCRERLSATFEAFARRYSVEAQEHLDAPANEARKLIGEGRLAEAVRNFRRALSLSPRDWYLLGQLAEVLGRLRDFEPALKLAKAAVALNPWHSVWLWNVLGDCLFGVGRFDEAHEAYLRAQRIDPEDTRTQFDLSYTLLQFGRHEDALMAIAKGLSKDRQGALRQQLLDKQSQIVAALTARWQAENEQFAKHNIRFG